MEGTVDDEQEMLHALEYSGMEPEMIEQFMQSFRLKRWDNGRRILASHRSKLLSDVHERQDMLFCMDLMIRKLRTF